MRFRLASIAMVISALSGCTVPRAALATGAVTMIAGGALFAHESGYQHQPCDAVACGPDLGGFAAAGEDVGSKLFGTVLLVVGVGLITGGLVGLAQEHDTPPANRPVATAVARAPAEPVPAPAAPPPEDSVLRTHPPQQLAVQLRVAAHAGHCETAAYIAHQLARLDGALAVEVVESDHEVARCLVHRM